MYHFIINPKSSSGRGIRYWWTVKNELDNQSIPYTSHFTKYAGHATELAEQICGSTPGVKNLIIIGGDGTVNEVINGILDYNNLILGYIPSGSSNDLARSLNIPKDPLQALSNILKPKKFQYLDYGEMNFPKTEIKPRKFACSSGIGYDANVCLEVQVSPTKRKLNRFGAGKFIYLLIAIKQIISLKHVSGTIIVDDIKKGNFQNILLVSSMIHKYEGGGLLIAPEADPTDQKLSICLVYGLSRLKIALLLPTILFGKHIHVKGVETFHCNKIEVILDQDAAIHTDGEIPAIGSHIVVQSSNEQIRMIL